MLVACLPLNALSAGEPPAAGSAALPPAETSGIEESSEVCIVEEDLSKRGEYEKHFLCSDGTYIAVTYAEPVHYLDADGTWADTDVALSLNTASSRYEAQSGGFAVSFASAYSASAQQPAAVSMTDGAFPVSWTTAVAGTLLPAAGRSGLQASASCDALVPYTPSVSVLTAQQSQAASLQSFAGRPVADADSFAAPDRISVAQYTGIAQTAGQSAGVSLRYSVSQHRIKEDIIIADKSAVTDFVTTLDIGALTAAPQDDGSVLLTDGNGDTVYTVGVPYLYDAEYNVSYDVEVTVSQTGSVCRITYSPDREWMFSDERVYPVVLDPTITSGEYAANIVDTYVTQADSNNHSGEGNLVVGIKSGKINRAYIKINNLPSLPDDVVPLSANLTIKHGANTTTGRAMSLYYAGSSWNQSTITYTNQPSASTFIRSCAFNTSNVLFSFNSSQIQTLYQKSGSNTNYGFQLRYSSESTTNPDYNMLRSMEYPTASEQPCFTVNYGYSLPESLSAGEIYLFKNADSGKYMDVQNGTDANDTNVIQWGWNGSAAQQFKLELSSTGNGYILRSQVGGKTRVLDIYKTNGRVENGNNVQIYTNIDPKAQEWLILPVDATKFRIVPRSNPALSLTSYGSSNGTADGRTTTSAGNVFVSTYTGATNQLWEIYDTDRNRISNDFIGILSHGKYYMINRYSSRFIKNVGNMVYVRDGFTDLAMFSNEWLITQTDSGKYCIQPANRSDLFLCGDTETQTVGLYGSPVSYWDYTNAPQAGPLLYITSGGTQYALAESDGELVLRPRLTQPGTEEYFSQSWRFISVGSYVALSSVSFSDLSVDIGESVNANIASKNPTNASLTLITDFTYEVDENSPQDIVSVNNVTGYFTGEKAGTTTIVATHKVTGKTNRFDVLVNPIIEQKNIIKYLKDSFSIKANIHNSCSVNWDVSDSNIITYTIENNIIQLTCKNTGSARITASYGEAQETCLITVYAAEDGIYRLKNLSSGLYVDVDGNANNENNILEQWDGLNADQSQLWRLQRISGNYYTLQNEYSKYYMTVPSSKITENNADIIQASYQNLTTQRWKIVSQNEKIIITPCSGESNNLQLAVNNSIFNGNGVDIHQISSVNDDRNKWELEKPSFAFSIILYNNSKDSLVESIQNKSSANNKYGMLYTAEHSKSLLLYNMQNIPKILVACHARSYVIANDDTDFLTIHDIKDLPNNAFSESEFIFLAGCYTASHVCYLNHTGECIDGIPLHPRFSRGEIDDKGILLDFPYENICEAIYNKGAPIVGGWTKAVELNSGSIWIKEFAESIANGLNVWEASSIADNISYYQYNDPRDPEKTHAPSSRFYS